MYLAGEGISLHFSTYNWLTVRVKIAVIRSKLALPISANIADVKFYHNTIAFIGPYFKQTLARILSVDSFYVR